MSHRSFSPLRWLRRMALAAVAVGTWSSAQAAVYHGVWDPPYGSPFGTLTTGLGWRGAADFYVPESCEVSSGLVDNYGNLPFIPGNCGGLGIVTSASVELYQVNSSDQHTLATLTFDPTSFYVGILRFAEGELTGLLTDFSNRLTPSSDGAASPADLAILDAFGPLNPWTTQFSLIFGINPFNGEWGPQLWYRNCSSSELYTLASAYYPSCTEGHNSFAQGFQPVFTITRVPEPATLGLVGIALMGAVTLSGRRRRRNSA
jgi:hypothetical protein